MALKKWQVGRDQASDRIAFSRSFLVVIGLILLYFLSHTTGWWFRNTVLW